MRPGRSPTTPPIGSTTLRGDDLGPLLQFQPPQYIFRTTPPKIYLTPYVAFYITSILLRRRRKKRR